MINKSLKTAENGLKSNSINIYADSKIKNKKIITYANAKNHHKHAQGTKTEKIKIKKILKKFCGRVVNRPARPVGASPCRFAYLRPFKGLFTAQGRIYHDNNANG